MQRSRNRRRGTKRGVLAWCGLVLMAASVVWLQLLPDWTSPLSMKTRAPSPFSGLVVLDPGHGGDDSGTICGSKLEKDLTLDVAKRVQRLVREKGFATMLTRDGDRFMSLASRVELANRQSDCVFVSIHFNDGQRQESGGIETYYAAHQNAPHVFSWLPFLQTAAFQPPNSLSQSLAGFIQDALVLRTQAANRGIKTEQFYVIDRKSVV